MVSPHPSYPPLEMSTFGAKVVTNCYANKDLSGFNENMTCLADGSPRALSKALLAITSVYSGEGTIAVENDYAKGGRPFGCVVEDLSAYMQSELGLDKK